MKRRRDELIDGRVREQIAGELFDGECVVRLILVERADDPVAVGMDCEPQRVGAVALAVGIAGEVEPGAGPAFAELRCGEKPVHDLLIGIGRFVGDESVNLGGCRGQADQRERDPANQRVLVRLG